ncbi:MAG TPA: asparagine synthase (glutamine-hydrolyzing) [Candidatus Hydrogenedentes bacterium]|nr:asparagine synthase (glutamine-hydrolyzing) [Candidatus Hydrogenedentota bacterium]
MCGIAGIAGKRDEALIKRMTDRLAHRGPDAEGFYADDCVTLGHRRLSIIDLSTGQQPMSNEDGTLWVVFNGEIYNFQELRRALETKGHRFRTQSDTEVILASYAEYGEACVEHFQGMFAFALWDTQTNTLLLARDPIGVKPLYYAEADGVLYFASEMKALLTAPGISREMDYEGLDDYLTYLYTVPPRTFFKQIRQLPPGHMATWRAGTWTETRYWRLRMQEESKSAEAWVEAVREQFHDIFRKYMISDVPLGAFLSGGLDSATIVYHMMQQASAPVNTFTVGFANEGALYDESPEARSIAKYLGATHRELKVQADAAPLMPVILQHFDEPFGNPTALLVYSICKLVREHVTVILSGDGGDECFGGYARYAGARLAEMYRHVPAWLRGNLVNPLVQRLPESTRGFHALRRIREFSAGTLLDPVDMYAVWISYFQQEDKQRLYTNETRRAIGSRDALDFIRTLGYECESSDPVTRAMYIDIHSFLPNNVLQYGDRMSMAHSLEARVPLADHKLVELLARMPSRLKVRGTQGKVLMRQSMAGRLPEEVLHRKKAGFNPPMGVWLNTQLRPRVDEYLSEAVIQQRGLFNPAPIQAMIQDHRASRRDYTWHLWALLLLEEWFRNYLD